MPPAPNSSDSGSFFTCIPGKSSLATVDGWTSAFLRVQRQDQRGITQGSSMELTEAAGGRNRDIVSPDPFWYLIQLGPEAEKLLSLSEDETKTALRCSVQRRRRARCSLAVTWVARRILLCTVGALCFIWALAFPLLIERILGDEWSGLGFIGYFLMLFILSWLVSTNPKLKGIAEQLEDEEACRKGECKLRDRRVRAFRRRCSEWRAHLLSQSVSAER